MDTFQPVANDFLSRILRDKRLEVSTRKATVPQVVMEARAQAAAPPLSALPAGLSRRGGTAAAARPGPQAGCVLVLEDLHWADQETLALLEYLADSLAAERAVCLATLREAGYEQGGEAAALASALAARGSAAVLEEGILYAEIDVTRARTSRQQFDPVGHYSRPDIFRLCVDTSPRTAVTEPIR